jgi:hypothetical protein
MRAQGLGDSAGPGLLVGVLPQAARLITPTRAAATAERHIFMRRWSREGAATVCAFSSAMM